MGSDDDDPATGPTSPTNRFERFDGNVSYLRPVTLLGKNFSFSSTVQGQYSEDFLPGTEQMSIGGRFNVRGFDDVSISGDRGAYIRNELSFILPQSGAPIIDRTFGTVSPYVGFDAGTILSRGDAQPGGSLTGAVLGVRNFGGLIGLDTALGVPLGGREDLTEDSVVFYFQSNIPF